MFKLIGPVLIKQDLVEAKSNVTKRLEFIQNETLVKFIFILLKSGLTCLYSQTFTTRTSRNCR